MYDILHTMFVKSVKQKAMGFPSLRDDLRLVDDNLDKWRKFNFFEVRKNVDGGKIAKALQDTTIEVCTSGHSQLVIGDGRGWVHTFSRAWAVTSFKAYDRCIFQAVQLRHDPCLVTVGEDETGIKSVIKVWDGSRQDAHGPVCVRVTKLSRLRGTPTTLAVHENKSLMALGYDDGTLVLFRGDITRRSSKETDLRNKPPDGTAITGLAFRGTSHLFVASRSSIMLFTINSSGKERGISMDEDASGCRPHCAVLVHDQQFVVARNDAIYCYTTDGRGPCYALEGFKKRVDWFRSYLVTISKDNETPKISSSNDETVQNDHITILDIQNKFIVFSMALDEIKAVLTEWGAFYIITEDKQVHHLDEKDLQSKLFLLFKKNLFDVAIRIASSQKYDSERLIDIYTQYGDHLFKKGDPKGAVEQYVKTIGRLETSYVIRKYLESRHLEPLTYYLQELHKMGLATEDHTTLLLTCFVKLDQHDHHGKLKEFINAKNRVIDFDIEIAIKVCRQVSSDDALHLAKQHKQHDWFLRIATEDKKDFLSALNYIGDLEFDEADYFMKKYGNMLIQHSPAETTQFLKQLCIDYKPKNKPLVDDAMMAGIISRNQIDKARPEEYLHLFLNNSERLVEFLEHLVKCESNWSTLIYNTLIEHHLHIWSGLKDKPTLRETYEDMVVKLLQNSEANYDKDQTLIVCLMLNFTPGILYLYEEYKLYQQILRYHITQKDMDSAMNCCRKFGTQEPHLWVEMLWCPPPSQYLPEVLNVIANQRLLSPLLVIDCLANSPTCTLQYVRKYLNSVLTAEEEISTREATTGDQLRGDAERVRAELRLAALSPMVCQASRCAACSRQLELPARHFLCTHSYHQHCIQSFSESEDECPSCVSNNKKLLEVLRNQGTSTQTTEAFHAQLERASDGFSVVAEYFGRGIFNKLTIIPGDETSTNDNKVPAQTKSETLPSNLNSTSAKILKPIKTDLLNYGPGAEARLRLEEGNKTASTNENLKSNNLKSSVLVPTPEAKMRLMEKKRNESQYSSSLEANIVRYMPTDPQKYSNANNMLLNSSNDIIDRDSSKNSTPVRNSPTSLKSKKTSLANVDNISTESTSSSQKENKSISSKSLLNPFEDDSAYDDTKNPFAVSDDNDDEKNPFENDDKNPFA